MRITVYFLIFSIYCGSALSKQKNESTMTEDFSNYLGDKCLPQGHNGGKFPRDSSPTLCAIGTTSSPILSLVSSLLLTTDTSINSISSILNLAKPDADAYIATDGKNYHTAKLELAFQYIRKRYPEATDMQMAQAIAAY